MFTKIRNILLRKTSPEADRPLKGPKVPAIFMQLAVLFVVLSWIPLALIYYARVTPSESTRPYPFQGMGEQPTYEAQDRSPIFRDRRAMRMPVAGTVAFGRGRTDDGRYVQDPDLRQKDDHYYRGFRTDASGAPATVEQTRTDGTTEQVVDYYDAFPEQVRITDELMQRGQAKYNVYCAVCHGYDGGGQGSVHLRAQELETLGWVPPSVLTTQTIQDYSEGYLYNVIRNGVRTMPGYGSQIEVRDRWAIVAYLRALGRSHNASVNDLPPEQRDKLP